MIKVVNLVSLLIAPLIITVGATGGSMRTVTLIISGASLVALIVGVMFSLRESKDVFEG
jgi:hypothetical protein